jgi:hypothetical protein
MAGERSMGKKTMIHWLDEPEEHDHTAAAS